MFAKALDAPGHAAAADGRRNNNFNLVRLAAAVLVVFSHSFSISRAEGFRPLGLAFGDIAVDMFFVTSGFLVMGTALSRRDAVFFVWSRVLRIFPGLLVALGLTVFALGPLVTRLPLDEYLGDPQTYRFLFSNGSLIATEVQSLPGVFEANPVRFDVMHPLWSLEWEIVMYWALFLLTLPYLVSDRYLRAGLEAIRFIVPLIFLAALALLLVKFARDNVDNAGSILIVDIPTQVVAMFFGGASVWLWRDRINMSGRYGFLLLAFLAAAALVSPRLFVPVYYLSVVWLTLIIGQSDVSWLRPANNMGDYSYGIYIYSYPVQQTIAFLWVGIGAYEMFALSMLATLLLAFLSWHLVEKRALALKHGIRLRRRISRPAMP